MPWHDKTFDNESFAHDEVKAAAGYGTGWMPKTTIWNQMRRVPYCGNDSLFYESLIFPVCVDAAGHSGCYPRPTRCTTTAHITWAYIRARRRTARCMLVPILVVHSYYSTTISEGGVWGRVSDGMYKTPTKIFHRAAAGRCLRRQRGVGRVPNYDQ